MRSVGANRIPRWRDSDLTESDTVERHVRSQKTEEIPELQRSMITQTFEKSKLAAGRNNHPEANAILFMLIDWL